jgi:hypothetical protein
LDPDGEPEHRQKTFEHPFWVARAQAAYPTTLENPGYNREPEQASTFRGTLHRYFSCINEPFPNQYPDTVEDGAEETADIPKDFPYGRGPRR